MRVLLLIVLFFTYGFSIEYKISYFENKDKIEINDLKLLNYKELENQYISKGFNFNDFYIKLHIKNPSSQKIKKYLTLDNPTIDYIEFYEDNIFKVKTGDHQAFENREQRDIYFSFLLELEAYEVKEYYLKIRSKNTLSIRFTIQDENTYLTQTELKKFFLIFYTGFILSIIIYNGFLYTLLRENTYLSYIAFQVSVLILLLSHSGLGIYFVWQDMVALNEFALRHFDDLSLFMAVLFTKNFLNTKKDFPLIDKYIYVVLGLLFYVMVTPWQYHSLLVKPVMIGSAISILVIAIYAVYKKSSSAKLYLLGWTFLIIAAILTLLKNFGEIEANFLTTWSIYIGSMIEALVFSMALANKIETLKKEKEKALVISAELLNVKVKEKTLKLEEHVKQKDVLLKEIHHRVKNNLQIISSFINISQNKIEDEKSRNEFIVLQDRIEAVSLLHKKLYKYDAFEEINIKEYIEEIILNVQRIYNKDVNIEINIENISINFDKSVLLGLVVNEFLTNSFKYAFTNIDNAKINIEMKKYDDKYIIYLRDNGCGFDMENIRTNSMGVKMMQRLVNKQLEGKIDFVSNKNGTIYTIRF